MLVFLQSPFAVPLALSADILFQRRLYMDALREQMMKDLQLKGITPKTQKKYFREIGLMADYFNRPLEELGEKEVKDYLVHMLQTRKLSRGTY